MSNDKLQISNQILIPNVKLMYKILILMPDESGDYRYKTR